MQGADDKPVAGFVVELMLYRWQNLFDRAAKIETPVAFHRHEVEEHSVANI